MVVLTCFVMCGSVWGFCYVWVCVRVGFVMCGCVYVWVLYCVGVFEICELVFSGLCIVCTVFL